MKGHMVTTVERNGGYAARCDVIRDGITHPCGITFGGFETRSAASEALTHDMKEPATTAIAAGKTDTPRKENGMTDITAATAAREEIPLIWVKNEWANPSEQFDLELSERDGYAVGGSVLFEDGVLTEAFVCPASVYREPLGDLTTSQARALAQDLLAVADAVDIRAHGAGNIQTVDTRWSFDTREKIAAGEHVHIVEHHYAGRRSNRVHLAADCETVAHCDGGRTVQRFEDHEFTFQGTWLAVSPTLLARAAVSR